MPQDALDDLSVVDQRHDAHLVVHSNCLQLAGKFIPSVAWPIRFPERWVPLADHLWHYCKDGQSLGPVDNRTLKQLAASGTLLPADLVWAEGMAEWIPATKVRGLFNIVPPPVSIPVKSLPHTLERPSRSQVSPPDFAHHEAKRSFDPSETSTTQFWYSHDGAKHGPVTEAQLLDLIQDKTLCVEDSIWSGDLPDWQKIGDSKFARHSHGLGQPPPLTGGAVNNTFVWFLAFAPLLGDFLAGFLIGFVLGLTGFQLGVWFETSIFIVLNVGLCSLDEMKLKAAGHNTEVLGKTWFVPGYIYKRTILLKQNWAVFVIWCVTLLLSIGYL